MDKSSETQSVGPRFVAPVGNGRTEPRRRPFLRDHPHGQHDDDDDDASPAGLMVSFLLASPVDPFRSHLWNPWRVLATSIIKHPGLSILKFDFKKEVPSVPSFSPLLTPTSQPTYPFHPQPNFQSVS
ncbi:hypothetical protein PGT21_020068 [Puccinia graminis f. sp. tritici]|uniref:Uncharacterized protein n=1 Tax=Puccinia graminis f. sp. tritici TaxID=56615 RepID=A0A5B0Q666_PUCGR|nr:hypothetical protein PGT21_020068 [Puccinia graminis f. sp. tritici]